MKKGLIFVLFALVSIVSYSQLSWNAKVGMNMSNFTGDAFKDSKMRIGFNVGVGAEYQFTEMWSIQPSLMFTQKGTKMEESEEGITATAKLNPMYLEIPVLAAARFAIADNQNIVVKAGRRYASAVVMITRPKSLSQKTALCIVRIIMWCARRESLLRQAMKYVAWMVMA